MAQFEVREVMYDPDAWERVETVGGPLGLKAGVIPGFLARMTLHVRAAFALATDIPVSHALSAMKSLAMQDIALLLSWKRLSKGVNPQILISYLTQVICHVEILDYFL